MTFPIQLVKKVKGYYQYDIPGNEGNRIIYTVDDRRKEALVHFIGTHDEAKTFRKNFKAKR